MPFNRMDAALSVAQLEASDPQQFVLNWPDYQQFTTTTHPAVKSWGNPVQWAFRSVIVTKATDKSSPSVLHVLGSRPIFTNPIPV